MRLEHVSVDELIKKFDSIGDAELSLADRQWLKANIKELIATATTTNAPSPSRQVETLVSGQKLCVDGITRKFIEGIINELNDRIEKLDDTDKDLVAEFENDKKILAELLPR
jgi:hypothetical protein